MPAANRSSGFHTEHSKNRAIANKDVYIWELCFDAASVKPCHKELKFPFLPPSPKTQWGAAAPPSFSLGTIPRKHARRRPKTHVFHRACLVFLTKCRFSGIPVIWNVEFQDFSPEGHQSTKGWRRVLRTTYRTQSVSKALLK